jgi:hypothetical protein
VLLLLGIIYEIIFPQKPLETDVTLHPEPYHNFWLDAQKEHHAGKSNTYKVSSDSLDDPSEAWHEADEAGDSDDPEIYNDIYDK